MRLPGSGVWVGRVDVGALPLRAGIRAVAASQSNAVRTRAIATAALLLTGLAAAAPASASVAVVAYTGQRAPGTEAGVVFDSFGDDVLLDDAGHLLFQGTLAGPGIFSDISLGLWRGVPGAVAIVARSGDPGPGLDGEQLGVFDTWSQTASGDWGFVSTIASGDDAGEDGIWVARGGAPVYQGQTGQAAPGTPSGVVFDRWFELGLGDAAGVVRTTVAGPGVTSANDNGVWGFANGSFVRVAREGDPAPDVAPPDPFGVPNDPAISPAGAIAFFSRLASGARGIWVDAGGGPARRHLTGDPIPGGGGPTLDVIGDIRIDATNRLSFYSSLGNSQPSDAAVLDEEPGGTVVAARVGADAPDISRNVWFRSLSDVRLGATGALAFRARLDGEVSRGDDVVVYRDLGAGPKVVWREGDVAEGTAVFTDSFDVGISDGGRVVIDAQVTGPDVDASNFRALFWIDLAGEPHRLLRYGDAIEVAPGDSRIVTEHWVAGVTVHRQAGRGNGMNATRVATRVRFDDGPQAVLLVPEPGSTHHYESIQHLT